MLSVVCVCVTRICSRSCVVNRDEVKCTTENELNPKAQTIHIKCNKYKVSKYCNVSVFECLRLDAVISTSIK